MTRACPAGTTSAPQRGIHLSLPKLTLTRCCTLLRRRRARTQNFQHEPLLPHPRSGLGSGMEASRHKPCNPKKKSKKGDAEHHVCLKSLSCHRGSDFQLPGKMQRTVMLPVKLQQHGLHWRTIQARVCWVQADTGAAQLEWPGPRGLPLQVPLATHCSAPGWFGAGELHAGLPALLGVPRRASARTAGAGEARTDFVVVWGTPQAPAAEPADATATINERSSSDERPARAFAGHTLAVTREKNRRAPAV